MSNIAVRNARANLMATALNNMAFIVAGFVAPTVNRQLSVDGNAIVTLAWIVIGFGLHSIAQSALGSLRSP